MIPLAEKHARLVAYLIDHLGKANRGCLSVKGEPHLIFTNRLQFNWQGDDAFVLLAGTSHNKRNPSYVWSMEFVVIDKRKEPSDYGLLYVYPIAYRSAYNNGEATAVDVNKPDQRDYDEALQEGIAKSATVWLDDLEKTGYFPAEQIQPADETE